MKPFKIYVTVGSSLPSTHRCFLATHKTSIVDPDPDRILIQWGPGIRNPDPDPEGQK
jgi:hypothetical protein